MFGWEGVEYERAEFRGEGRGQPAVRGRPRCPGRRTRASAGRMPGILAAGEWGRGGANRSGDAQSGHLGALGGGETSQRSGLERWPGGSRGDERMKGARTEAVAVGTGGRGKDLRGVTEPRARWEIGGRGPSGVP